MCKSLWLRARSYSIWRIEGVVLSLTGVCVISALFMQKNRLFRCFLSQSAQIRNNWPPRRTQICAHEGNIWRFTARNLRGLTQIHQMGYLSTESALMNEFECLSDENSTCAGHLFIRRFSRIGLQKSILGSSADRVGSANKNKTGLVCGWYR